nr:putative reverse transcriptase domain-containing protein [Tanacetum cinerariifolium]
MCCDDSFSRRALSFCLGGLALPSHFHKKFRCGIVFATGLRSFIEPGTGFRMKRTNYRTRVPISLYPCLIEGKMTIKEVKGESVIEWKTKLTAKEGIVIKFSRKFRGYKLVTKEKVEENEGLKEVWEQIEYVISDSDLDLESIASTDGESVKVDRVICDCKLELGNSLFTIDLIPLGHGSFDVIVGMDWLSKNKAVIVCHEKVVEIPIKEGGILRVRRERTWRDAKALMNTKVDEPRISGIPMVRDFTDVFPEDLLGLPPQRQVEFRIDLVPRATPVAKYVHFEITAMSFGLNNAPAVFMDLMNQVCKPYLDKFVIVFIDDIPIYSKMKKEHEVHLKLVLESLKKAKLYAKFSKYGIEYFVVYYDASNQGLCCVLMQRGKSVIYTYHKSLQHIFDQKVLNICQRRWIQLFSDYECEIRYHPSKANVVADALSRKERVKPRHVRAMAMTIQSEVKEMILIAHRKEDGSLYFMANIWVPLVGDVRMTDGQCESTIQTLEDMLRVCVIDFGGSWDVYLSLAKFSYNNSYHSSIRCASFEDLYDRKCRSPVLWAEIGEGSLIGPELVPETTDKVVLIKENLKAVRDRQKSYADKRRKPLEFEVGDQILLKVLPWKGVVLRLPEELNSVHDTFHVSNLKKCLANANLHVPLDEIKVDKTLCFVEEPVEITNQEIKKLKRRKIVLVKVRWNSKRGLEVFKLELRDFPYKINQTVNEVVKEAVHIALQAPLRDYFGELSEADMKEILHQRMFESGSYKSLPKHVTLIEALEASMEWANMDEFLVKKEMSSKQHFAPHMEQPVKDVPIPDDVNISDLEDTDTAHLSKIKTRPDWLKPLPKEDRPKTPKSDWIIPSTYLPEVENNWADALAKSCKDPEETSF